jgi:hypothetical protein
MILASTNTSIGNVHDPSTAPFLASKALDFYFKPHPDPASKNQSGSGSATLSRISTFFFMHHYSSEDSGLFLLSSWRTFLLILSKVSSQ